MSSPAAREARAAARELGARLSCAAALAVALVALLQSATLGVACAWGAGTLAVLACGTRLGAAVVAKAIELERKPKEGAQ